MPGGEFDARRTSFGAAADDYAFGRPSYPIDALTWALPPGAQDVLDVGAGTGRLTERLLRLGMDVIAVEPSDDMRARIPTEARTLAGTAEALPIDDASVDAVVAGQAFHWFDVPRAMAEIARVLRPRGTVGLFWNLLDDSDDWVAEFADLVDAEDRASLLRTDAPPPYADITGVAPPQRRLFRHVETFTTDRLAAFVRSRSQTILLDEDARAALLRDVVRHSPSDEFALPFVCEAWRGERLAAD